MKQRFSSLDIKIIAHELSKSLLNLRVNNIYDLSSRIFLIKFAKPDHREQLVIDSGFRCHLTSYSRTTAAEPSPFVSRLRKWLKTRRVTSISQVGTDRILEFQFSDGQYRLFLEFYAAGNIVLTDGELKIIALQRNVNEGAEHERIRAGSLYNISERQNADGVPPITLERLKNGLQKHIDRLAATADQPQPKKAKKKSADVLRKALAGAFNEFPPPLLDHALRVTDFNASLSPEEVLGDTKHLDGVIAALTTADEVVKDIMAQEVVKGYIGAHPSGNASEQAQQNQGNDTPAPVENIMYFDYQPFKPKQYESDGSTIALQFDGFNRTVDEFYSSIEGQKLEARLQEKGESARRKLENAKDDQAKRIGGLQEVQALNIRKAQAIEANLERVKEATAAINDLIGKGMDWVEINSLIELEQKRRNPVAEVIALPLKLQENTATLRLGEWEDLEDDEQLDEVETDSEPSISDEDEASTENTSISSKATNAKSKTTTDSRIAVDIDLSLSAWSNAREYYDQKKSAAVKEEKTIQASSKALKSAQQKIDADLKKALQQEHRVLRPVRNQYWFEKFLYFISSDGYLVIGGKDAQQSDILYKKHLKKGDVFVHAEPNGASVVIIKNNPSTPDAPIPPSTLSQAGNLSISTSTCWDSKAVMSAWWASADQVSKVADTGDYLGQGKFYVRSQKNFLPPAQLLLGFAVVFQISEASKANHLKHRLANSNIVEDSVSKSERTWDKNNDGMEAPAAGDDAASDQPADEPDQESEDDEREGDYANPFQAGNPNERDDADNENSISNDEAEAIEPNTGEDDVNAHINEDTENLSLKDQPETGSDREESAADSQEQDDGPAQHQTPAPTAGKPKGPTPVRGKKGKKKKIANKYADQDDEDREEAMRLLGSKSGQERAHEEAQARLAREEEAEQAKQRRREQHERAQREGRAREERKMLQEEAADEEEEPHGAAVDLDALIGTPLPGDEIVEAIPVCAPWSALGRYKYKAKMQPGSVKKGKAVREILGKWAADAANKRAVDEKSEDTERIWPREIELIKNWKDVEVFGVVPVSKVRVMMSGASNAKDGKGGGGQQKQKGKGGKGSKKSR